MDTTSVDLSAQWITHPEWVDPLPELTRVPILRHRFMINEQPSAAVLDIVGLGVWNGTLDGEPLNDAVLEPGSSEFRQRVAVTAIDLASRLSPGSHELVVELGEGSAHVRHLTDRYTKFEGTVLTPRLVAELRITDADGQLTLVRTDETWQASLGQTTVAHWYGGEDYDATLVSTEWVPVQVLGNVADGGPKLWTRQAPPVRVISTIDPISRTRLDDGSVLVDFGVNHAGRPVLTTDATVPSGTRIELWPGEDLLESGHVDQTSTGKPIFDSYTASAERASWHPRFCYHGYRYVELRARSDDHDVLGHAQLVSQKLHSDNARTGTFNCSDVTLNTIYQLTDRAVQSNLFSVLTDCPHREKLGWLEQLHLVFSTLSHCFDVRPQLADMVHHMMDVQTGEGLVPDIAPELTVFGGGFRDDVNWGSAIVQLPWHLWRTYGDLAPARMAWPAIERYVDYLDGQLVDGLLPAGLADWKTLDRSIPPTLVHGHGYIAMMVAAAELADQCGRDGQSFAQRAEEMRRRLAAEHLGTDGVVGSGSQSSWALALDAEIVPVAMVPAAVQRLCDTLQAADFQISVGEIGLPPLIRVLAAAGRHDLLLALVTQPDGPGYVNMINSGCTALAETWEVVQGEASANHFMLGYVNAWFVESVAGLRQAPSSTGWATAVIEPAGVDLLDGAATHFVSPRGRYFVAWRKEPAGDRVQVEIAVPADGLAEWRCPPGWTSSTEHHQLAAGDHQIELVRTDSVIITRSTSSTD